MKRTMAVALVLVMTALVLSCQAPQEFMEKMDKQLKATEELGKRVDDLEAKLNETIDSFNELAGKFDEHMETHHKKKVTTKPVPKVRPPAKK